MMEQQRRLTLFFTLSLAILLIWSQVIVPQWFPKPPPQPPIIADELDELFDVPVSALAPANVGGPEVAPAQPVVADHPRQTVELGSADPQSPFFLQVTLSTRGAVVEAVRLNDPRYPEHGDRGTPLTLVGHDALSDKKTFATAVALFDQQLKGQTLEEVDWEVVPGSMSDTGVTFRITSPDGSLEVTKEYVLKKVDAAQANALVLRDTWGEGYQLQLKLQIRNLGDRAQEVAYELRGPVGLPLEDPLNSHKFRDVRMGFLRNGDGVDTSLFTAKEAVDQEQENAVEVWKRPLKFIGVDTQYFAALVQPVADQARTPTIEAAQAEVISAGKKEEHADVSVRLTSLPKKLAPAGDNADRFVDEYVLYAGPKRPQLLASVNAEAILDYGMFAPLVRLMLGILDFLQGIGLGYGLAIIGLTCVVRAAMIPITRHQYRSMDRMKELQPRIKLLHEKYKKNPESLTPDEMREMRDVNLKVFSGCLPLFLQMPIFIALYHSLQVSVDLRMAPFHLFGEWIDNLASPDALFSFGFTLPLLGWTEFNLLPWLSIGLMILNQKFTMPPPADEEQALQYKMMNVMMVVMVVMFYRVPSGLCLYFIASSLWGTSERLLMKHWAAKRAAAKGDEGLGGAPVPLAPAPAPTGPAAPARPSLLDDFKSKLRELQELADKEASLRREAPDSSKSKKPRGRR